MLILLPNGANYTCKYSYLFVQMFQFCFSHRVTFNQASYVLLSDSLKRSIHNHYVNMSYEKLGNCRFHTEFEKKTKKKTKCQHYPKIVKVGIEMSSSIVPLHL